MEGDYLLKEIKERITSNGMREVSHRGRSWPGDDRSEEDTEKDGASYAVHHQKQGEDAAGEDAQPHGRVAQDTVRAVVW